MLIPFQASLIVEAEDEQAMRRWLDSLTFTDECTADCLYGFEISRGTVTARIYFDPLLVKEASEKLKPESTQETQE